MYKSSGTMDSSDWSQVNIIIHSNQFWIGFWIAGCHQVWYPTRPKRVVSSVCCYVRNDDWTRRSVISITLRYKHYKKRVIWDVVRVSLVCFLFFFCFISAFVQISLLNTYRSRAYKRHSLVRHISAIIQNKTVSMNAHPTPFLITNIKNI